MTIFRPKCGIQQGNPMLPFLFIISLEFVSTRLHQVMEQGRIELYSQGNTTIKSQLSYVDDVVVFCRANRKSFEMLQDILEDFSTLVGLDVSMMKSYMVFATVIDNTEVL